MYDFLHTMRKLRGTLRIAFTLVLSRTFGKYRHSVTNDEISYAVYEWRGSEWGFPTQPLDKE